MRFDKTFWLIKYRDLQRAFYRAFPDVQRRHYINYAIKEYGYTREFVTNLYDECEENFVPGRMDFLKFEKTVGSDFFYRLASRSMSASATYTCVKGNCSIMWDEERDRYNSAFGLAGCDCNDERDMSTRRVTR